MQENINFNKKLQFSKKRQIFQPRHKNSRQNSQLHVQFQQKAKPKYILSINSGNKQNKSSFSLRRVIQKNERQKQKFKQQIKVLKNNFSLSKSQFLSKQTTQSENKQIQILNTDNLLPSTISIQRQCQSLRNSFCIQKKTQQLQTSIHQKIKQQKSTYILYFQPTKAKKIKFNNLFRLSIHDFQIGEVIGQGSFGKVYLARYKKTGFFVALKQILKSSVKDIQQFAKSIRIHYNLRHANICQLFGVFSTKQSIYLMLELCCQGNLSKMRKYANDKHKDRLIQGVYNGIQYLHINNIRHGDIKLQNMLISYGVIKITDMDCIYKMQQQNVKRSQQNLWGTPAYFSPQMIMKKQFNLKDDLWAMGVMLYQIYYGSHPFDLKGKQQLQAIIQKQIKYYPKKINEHIKFIIINLLIKDVDKRLKIDEIGFILNKI